jgi:hypothetical protein
MVGLLLLRPQDTQSIGDDFASSELTVGIERQITVRESDTEQIDALTEILVWPCG